MNQQSEIGEIISAGVIGTGQYTTAVVTQAESIPQLNIPIVADKNIEAARKAFHLAGIADDEIVFAYNQEQASKAIQSGQKVVIEDAQLMMDLPLEVIVEGTGNAIAGAVHAQSALKNGKHVVMVTKEVDIVVGPILRQMAKAEGLAYTAADGDQPSLLIALVEWARRIGLEILSGGKFGEQKLFADLSNKKLLLSGDRELSLAIEQANLFHQVNRVVDPSELIKTVTERRDLLNQLIDIRTDDLTELGIVANVTGLKTEKTRLHHPILWLNEIPATLSPKTEGGLLEQRGVVEQVTYIRSANDNSMSGGVFLTVNANNAYSRQIIQSKGHIGNKNGTSFLIFRPYHLCGVETPYSILSVATKKHFLVDQQMKQYYDSFGRSRTSLLAGSIISGSHNSDFETFLAPATTETNSDASTPIPYHLTTGLRLKNDIPADTVLTHQMIDNLAESSLWQLRIQQNNKIGLIN